MSEENPLMAETLPLYHVGYKHLNNPWQDTGLSTWDYISLYTAYNQVEEVLLLFHL